MNINPSRKLVGYKLKIHQDGVPSNLQMFHSQAFLAVVTCLSVTTDEFWIDYRICCTH
jgi:hypothetical protein